VIQHDQLNGIVFGPPTPKMEGIHEEVGRNKRVLVNYALTV